jgi:hypothetical protein
LRGVRPSVRGVWEQLAEAVTLAVELDAHGVRRG